MFFYSNSVQSLGGRTNTTDENNSLLVQVTLNEVTRTFGSTQSLGNHSLVLGPTAGNHTFHYLATKLPLN